VCNLTIVLIILISRRLQPLLLWRQQHILQAMTQMLIHFQCIQFQLFLQDSLQSSHPLSLQILIIWISLFISNMSKEKTVRCITNRLASQCLINHFSSTLPQPQTLMPKLQLLPMHRPIHKQQREPPTNLQPPINPQTLTPTPTQQQMQIQTHLPTPKQTQALLSTQQLRNQICKQQSRFQ